MPAKTSTNLEHQIRSQPDALTALLGSADVRRQVHEAAERLHRSRRLWVVGTGTSLHAAELGASLIQLSGRQAHAVPAMQFVDFAPLVGPQDGVIVITHTAETAFALSTRAQAFTAGLGPVMITKRGSGFPDAIETVDKETSDTYTVSYTTAVLALAMLAKELGADQLDDATLGRVPAAVAAAIADPAVDAIPSRNGCSCSLAPVRAPSRRGRAHSRSGRHRASSRRATTRSTCCTARRCPSTPVTGWWRCSHRTPAAWSRRSRVPASPNGSRSRV